ncbi:MAG: ATP-binding protein [Nitrospirota bacterium]|jgi:two-component system sensor histidine kinase ChiS|nr:ATP-binding protein [Nitrospirota bacterium]MDH4360015.1 ATP-binding protein [Nitrospirota bacterium]MDH5295723.1 ATP-binding protein [Nitrospirota bacterium]
MLNSDCQVTSELPSLRMGMVGLQEVDLSLSCQRVLASQGSTIQITWLGNASIALSSIHPRNPYDLILLDCRAEGGRTGMAGDIKSIFGDALIMGLIDEADSAVEDIGEAAIDWLVNENVLAIAMQWAIREGRLRKRVLQERDQLQRQLEDASFHNEMAEIASTVLHNVGNVLNSVNVAVNVVHELVNQSSVVLVHRIAELLKGHGEDWGRFLTQDHKGKRIPPALVKLGSHLIEEQQTVLKEIQGLVRNIDHVKQIIFSHQTMAKSRGMCESLSVVELVDQAVELSFQPGDAKWLRIQRDYQPAPAVLVDRHQLLQILVNLLRNAKQAMQLQGGSSHFLTVGVEGRSGDGLSVVMTIRDTGIGIAPEHLARMFTRGFTTKHDGNGIGLHSSMGTIHSMGGSLQVHSDGIGTGATFILTLPVQAEAMPT